jgi:glycosyltransferase involved in cell wall biosynthesis
MRILHILNHTQRLSGNVHAAIDLACAQVRLGHDVSVCYKDGDFDSLLDREGVGRIILNQDRSILNIVKATFVAWKLVSRFDIVHAHMMTSAMIVFPSCCLRKIPMITTVHNAFQRSAIIMGLGTRIIAVSEAVATSMKDGLMPKRRIRVVLNGTIGSARFSAPSTGGRDPRYCRIVFVGGLHPRKGLPSLLQAFDEVYSSNKLARLTIVGEGPFASEYKNLSGKLNSSIAVDFVGSALDPRKYLRGADIFVLPSLADPAPLVLCEAREAHCAIVATAVDGIPELLEYGDAGILVPPNDSRALATVLIELVNDSKKLEKWRQNSQIRIDRLSIERVARETVYVYNECLESSLPSDIHS